MAEKSHEWYASPYNKDNNVRSLMNLPKRITVFDSTLREGEETPGVTMSPKVKVKIARKLEKLGITEIEIFVPFFRHPFDI